MDLGLFARFEFVECFFVYGEVYFVRHYYHRQFAFLELFPCGVGQPGILPEVVFPVLVVVEFMYLACGFGTGYDFAVGLAGVQVIMVLWLVVP